MDRKAFVSTSTSSIVSFTAANILSSLNATDLLTEYDEDEKERMSSHRVDLYGDVTPTSCLNLIHMFEEINQSDESMNPHIDLHIQSFGGDLMSALFVLDYLDSIPLLPDTYVDGYACSAASLISCYGRYRYMTKRSCLLLHDIRLDMKGETTYNQRMSHHMKFIVDHVVKVYSSRSHLSETDVMSLVPSLK